MSWQAKADRCRRTAIQSFKTAAIYIRFAAPLVQIPIDGVFDEPDEVVDPQTGVGVQSVAPTFGIDLAALPAPPARKDQLIIGPITYEIIKSAPDGQGGSELSLNKVG